MILSHSTARIKYKHPANRHVKIPKHIYVCYMSRGEKCFNLVFKCFLLYDFSASKHSDTKDKIRLGNSPRFFSCISLFTLGIAFQTEVALQAESEKKKKNNGILINYRRVIYLAFLSEIFTLRKGNVGRWFPHICSNTGETN